MAPIPPARPSLSAKHRQRYEALEQQRVELITRLQALGDAAYKHPGYKRALKLLNDTFRKASLVQRAAVLDAATWLVDVLERLTMML
jgi:hypothetical protein